MSSTRTVTATPNGWTAWVVDAAAGDTIRVLATVPTGYGWTAVLDYDYNYLTPTGNIYPGSPRVVVHPVTKAGKYRIGVGRVGPVSVTIEVTTPAPPPPPPPPAPVVLPRLAAPLPFGPDSFWREKLSAARTLHPDSKVIVAELAAQVAAYYGGIAAFNVYRYNASNYTVPASTPRTRVAFNDAQRKGYTPSQLYSEASGAHFTDVPIPRGAVAASGTDGHLCIWCPETDQMWELWQAKRNAAGQWSAVWGGRLDNVSTAVGYFPSGMGVSATGVAVSMSALTLHDVEQGRVEHELGLVIPNPRMWTDLCWPAQRSDGSSATSPIREGQRFRLDPAVDVAKLGGHPLMRLWAQGAQDYGVIVTDRGGCVAVVAESGSATVAAGGVDPWKAPLAGTPDYNVMRGFPWARMQALPLDYGKVADRVSPTVTPVVGTPR